MEDFIDALESCNLNDLGYRGLWYTWSNNRGAGELIRERLDRMVATSEWYSMFPFAEVENKAWAESDHCPLIPTTEEPNVRRRGPKRFYFEAIWTKNPACRRVIWKAWQDKNLSSFNQRLKKVEAELIQWHSINIGELNRKIKILQEQLNILKQSPPTDDVLQEEKQLSEAIEEEELYWSKRARELWLKEGDRNTAYYHAHASERRKRNYIKKIRDENGQWVEDTENIHHVVVRYFEELFKTINIGAVENIIQHVSNVITPEMNEYLNKDFTREEVYNALFQMHPSKAPGPDGMSPMFYQHFWDVVGEDTTRLALEILNNNGNVGGTK